QASSTTSEPAAWKDSPTPLLPRYRPMRNLPASSSTAVTAPPTHTSRQAMGTEGMNLKIMANSSAVMAMVTSMLTPWSSNSQPGISAPAQPPNAEMAALSTSETMSRKASPRISPKDSTRARRMAQTPLGL